MLTKRLVKHGNSLAIIVDRSILDLLGISEDTPVELRTNGRELVMRAAFDPRFIAAKNAIFKRFDKTFRDLAEFDKTGRLP